MVSEKARKLILSYEGLNQPSKWPGGASGITIGIGYDLGYENEDFKEDWSSYLTEEEVEKLSTAFGKRGEGAHAIANQFSDIIINRADAEAVFDKRSLPKYEEMTRYAFPGFDDLPKDTQGALVSLVFNRGSSMKGDGRIEMRAIRDLVPKGDLKGIADQIRAMKRLWVGKGLDGLLVRRDAEADLVEFSVSSNGASETRYVSRDGNGNSRSKIVDTITSVVRTIFNK